MNAQQYDLTELYILSALEEQIAACPPEQNVRLSPNQREEAVQMVLAAIPIEKRIFQAITTLPKQVSNLLSPEHKQYVSSVVELTLREVTARLTF